jgi:group I intron endonuclease
MLHNIELRKEPGIYIFTNKFNGKKYVGKANNIKSRFSLYYNPKQKRPFESALRKYGFDGFEIKIMYFPGIAKDDLLDLEETFIFLESSLITEHGYNVLLSGNDWTGIKRSPQSIEKSKLARTGMKRDSIQKQRMSDNSGLKGKKAWNRGIECKEETKEKLRAINKGKSPPNKGIPMSNEQKLICSINRKGKNIGPDNYKSKGVIQLTMTGEVIDTYDSMGIAYRSTNVTPSRICDCCKGKRKSSGGFIWRYKDD